MHARAVRLSFAGVRVADRSHFHALTSELEQHDLSVQPPAEQYERKRWLLDTLRPVLAKHTGGDLHVFGSCANGFWVKGSDIDTCLMIKRCQQRASCLTKLRLVQCLVRREKIGAVQVVPARVPVAKILDENSEEMGDLCVNNVAAIENTMFVATFASLDPRVPPLGRFIKHWAKLRGINERSQGTLSTYTLILQLFYFLQTRSQPVLPRFREILHPGLPDDADGVNAAPAPTGSGGASVSSGPGKWNEMLGELRPLPFSTDVEQILRTFATQNHETLGELIFKFFALFGGDCFHGGSEGRTVTVSDAGCEPNDLGVLVLKCPLTWKNVNPMTIDVWQSVHSEFRRAAELLQQGASLADLCEPVTVNSSARTHH